MIRYRDFAMTAPAPALPMMPIQLFRELIVKMGIFFQKDFNRIMSHFLYVAQRIFCLLPFIMIFACDDDQSEYTCSANCYFEGHDAIIECTKTLEPCLLSCSGFSDTECRNNCTDHWLDYCRNEESGNMRECVATYCPCHDVLHSCLYHDDGKKSRSSNYDECEKKFAECAGYDWQCYERDTTLVAMNCHDACDAIEVWEEWIRCDVDCENELNLNRKECFYKMEK